MTTPQDVQQFIGRTAVDADGSKVGKIGQVYIDERTGLPLWITVATGMLGTRQSFAPIHGSQVNGDQVTLAVSKDLIKNAPSIDDDGQIDATSRMPSTGTTPTTSAPARPDTQTAARPDPRLAARPAMPTATSWPTIPPACGAGTLPGTRPTMR